MKNETFQTFAVITNACGYSGSFKEGGAGRKAVISARS